MKSLLALVTFTLVVLTTAPTRAQEQWLYRTSDVTNNLWSVAHGGSPTAQWVAVGEQGTILTSPDGISWTKRPSGFPNRWLVSVGYGAGVWIAVGEGGLVLTSPDAVVWSPRTSGTTARLNGIAYGGARWIAVAESGELITSTDSATWTKLSPSTDRLRGLLYAYGQFVITGDNGLMRTTIDTTDYAANVLPGGFFVESVAYGRRAFVAVGEDGYAITSADAVTWSSLASGTGAYLRGITFFNGQFIAVGTGGAILTTPAPGTAWTARPSGTTGVLTAVAASDAAVVAVGLDGIIVRSAPTAAAPRIVAGPADSIAVTGDNVLFGVTATGSLPLSYQWRFNGTPLAGQTAERLVVGNVQSAQAGSYTVSIANALGTVTSAPTSLTLVASTASGPIVDATFAPTVTISGSIAAAVEQPDGKLLIGGSQFFVTAGVSPFALARLNLDGSLDQTFNLGTGLNSGGTISELVLQPDGKIIVSGNFTTFNAVARRNLLRLNADGTLDPTFAAADAITGAALTQIAVQPDGRILLLSGSSIQRLNRDGSLDVSFVDSTVGAPTTRLALLPSGRFLIAGNLNTPFAGSIRIRLVESNGKVDPVYPQIAPNGYFSDLRTLPDGGVLCTDRYSPFRAYSNCESTFRLNSDGIRDPSWRGINIATSASSSIVSSYAATPQGKVFQAYSLLPIVVGSTSPVAVTRSLRRYNSDASPDLSFDARGGPNGTITGIVPLRDGRTVVFGDFTAFDSVARPKLVRLVAANAFAVQPPVIVSVTPEAAAVRPDEPVKLAVLAAGSGPLTYVTSIGTSFANDGGLTVAIPTQFSGSYTFTVTVSNRAGTVMSAPVRIVVAPSVPVLTTQPLATAVATGRAASFTIDDPAGSAPFTYQWFRGSTLVGTGATLSLKQVTSADAGDYSVVVTNSLGSTRSRAVPLSVDATARLANLSTRASAGPDERTLIAGFVVSGAVPKTVLVRGVGAGLAAFGLTGLLPDPKLTLYDGAGRILTSNDNFDASATPSGLTAGIGAFALTNRLDAALSATLASGSYTVQVADTAGRSGVALVEIYAADNNTTRLVNLSSRAFVSTGAGLAIGGISVQGETPRQFLIRGIGPTLTAFGVTGALADPVLTLTTALGTTVATNDDWSINATATTAEITSASLKVGSFALSADSKDSVLLISLAPGNYTALISGANNNTGIALVEVYEVP